MRKAKGTNGEHFWGKDEGISVTPNQELVVYLTDQGISLELWGDEGGTELRSMSFTPAEFLILLLGHQK